MVVYYTEYIAYQIYSNSEESRERLESLCSNPHVYRGTGSPRKRLDDSQSMPTRWRSQHPFEWSMSVQDFTSELTHRIMIAQQKLFLLS
jgi:hypothetical protein